MADTPETNDIKSKLQSRFRGCLLGLAIGDAIGTTLEFKPVGSFVPITDMEGGGPFQLKRGQWTDDTSMALCLGESLILMNTFNPKDQMARYITWWKKGHLSSNGHCFDIGGTTRKALSDFNDRVDHPSNGLDGLTDEYASGNGSLMRLAPVTMFYLTHKGELGDQTSINDAIEYAGTSSRTTHATPLAIDACRYFSSLLIGAFLGHHKDVLLSEKYCHIPNELNEEIQAIANGSFKAKAPPDIKAAGYVPRTLEAALWAFYKTDSFDAGVLQAINLGDDADTVGAIYGQIAGAYYGYENIKQEWREAVTFRHLICAMADRLCLIPDAKYIALKRMLDQLEENYPLQNRQTTPEQMEDIFQTTFKQLVEENQCGQADEAILRTIVEDFKHRMKLIEQNKSFFEKIKFSLSKLRRYPKP